MSAAFLVGTGYAALQEFLAGCWRLGCGTTGGRNCLANRARSTVLLVVRLNLLEFWISFDHRGRKARKSHAPVGRPCAGLVHSSIFFLLPGLLNAERVPKNDRRNLCIFNGLEIAGSSHPAPGRETGSGWNTTVFRNESVLAAHQEFSPFVPRHSVICGNTPVLRTLHP